jgi:phosphatidylglycerol:prolipoprotein diacylglycerol transferase
MWPVIFDLPQWVPILGGEAITSFGVFMLFSFLTGGFVLKAWDFVFMAVIGGILGAKIYYIFLNYPRLIENPMGTIFSRGGLVWYGGFLGATALILWEAKRSKLHLGEMVDIMSPPLAIAYAVGRLGCFFVGDDWGLPTASWVGVRFPMGTPATTVTNIEQQFGIEVDPALIEKYGQVIPVHPTQLYEVGMSTLIFFVLWRIRKHGHGRGWLFMLWLIMAGIERFLVEFLRAKDDRFFGILTLAQMISLAAVAVGIAGSMKLRPAPATSGK